ncbi:MAG: HalOD1 output domain-containing protein [Halorhabdus sp.]
MTIVQLVAVATGRDHESMEPLYSAIDPDAVNDFLGNAWDDTVTLSFSCEGCSITAESSGKNRRHTDTLS